MQYLKPDLKEKIVKLATNEFYEFGYKGANMHRIAKAADITVGNIYRYFQSKESLYDYVVEKVYLAILDLINAPSSNTKQEDSIKESINKLFELCYHNRTIMIIVLTKSQGSKYQDIISLLKQEVVKRIQKEYPHCSEDIAEVISEAVVNGIIHFLHKYPNQPEQIKNAMAEMITYLFKDFDLRIKGEQWKE